MFKVIYRYVRISLKGSRSEYIKVKREAAQQIKERVEHFSQLYKFTYKKISIKNSKTRWGSCSKAGNLNFHYKVYSLPEELRDYVIVHELCHLKHFNHSKSFWSEVEKALPNYALLRKKLKDKA